MSVTVSNIKVEPMNAIWGEDIMQEQKITCIADVAGSLNNQYFLFWAPDGTKHYAWFDVNTGGADPAVSGGTAHEVDLATGATASAVATALQAVLTAVTGWDATVDGTVVTLVNTTAGYCKPATDGAADTGFTFEVVKYGDTATDIGAIEGDIEISLEAQNVEVTAHQHGTEVLSHINTGNNVGISINFKETTVSQLRKILLGQGDSLIPEGTGVSSTEVFGWGTSRQFQQTIARARKLVLHPQALPSSNKSRDQCFWLAYPNLESLTFSGENIMTVPVGFTIYTDFTKNPRISKFCYGDHTQTLTA